MYWNPTTFNNNDYAPALPTYDIPQAKLNWPYLHQQGVETPADFKKWAIQPTEANNNDPYKPSGSDYTTPPAEWDYYGGNQCGFVTQDDRTDPSKVTPKIQNPDFSLPSNRPFTTVTGFTDCHGYHTDDPWKGLALQLNLKMVPAKMVDVNPQLPWATQIFADTFTLGREELGHGFNAKVQQRMSTRWFYTANYNLTQDLMIAGHYSAVFQTCFKTEHIDFFDSDADSTSLCGQLCNRLQNWANIKGLMLRMTVYDTLYFQGKAFAGLHPQSPTPQISGDNRTDYMNRIALLYQQYEEQLEAYKLGRLAEEPKAPINRAYSRCVGWIGLWEDGELVSTPGGRYLIPFQKPETFSCPIQVRPKCPKEYKGDKLPSVALGPTAVEVQTEGEQVQRVTLDLSSTIPRYDASGKKAYFETLQIGIKLSEDDYLYFAELSYADYDQNSYEKTAGVIDIDCSNFIPGVTITAAQIEEHPLVIQVHSYPPCDKSCDSKDKCCNGEDKVALVESPFTAETDLRGLYVDEPNPLWDPSKEFAEFCVKVWKHGQKPPPNTHLMIAQYDISDKLIAVSESKAESTSILDLFYVDEQNGNALCRIDNATKIPVPASGRLTIKAKALQQGLPNLVFYPIGPDATGDGLPLPILYTSHDKKSKYSVFGIGPAHGYFFYTAARVLPFHNAMAVEFDKWLSEQPGPDVQEVNYRVFDEVYRTYHLMYPVMEFINSPLKFQQWRGRIEQVIDQDIFESARYMPVTRTLSAGQRQILKRYFEYLSELPSLASSESKLVQVTR
ncbi:hypothetical protein KFU94_33310 [Chloroflexi bacterium TSY]|nr:hypothetical protein [Chloroflexi bacterium TSY]